MYRLYERVQKSEEYPYGSKLIGDEENPFLEGPCLLCISAQKKLAKSVFGITKQGMKMARLRTRGEENAGFDIKNFPVKFLSIRLENDQTKLTEEEKIEIFTNTYLVPIISKYRDRITFDEAMKNMRNVNIMCYCDGTLFAQKIENTLLKQMKNLGYRDTESKNIISQMCVFPISTYRIDGNQKSTCISFKDINDLEVYDRINERYSEKVKKSPIGEILIKLSNNELAYLVDGMGDHNIKEYLNTGKALPASLCSIISKALQNSIENYNSKNHIKINTNILTEDIESIMNEAKRGKTKSELMKELDERIEYKGARKLSKEELELLDKLDKEFDNKIKIRSEIAKKTREKLNQEKSNQDQNIQNTVYSNKEKSEIISGFHVPCDEELEDSREIKAKKLQKSVEESNDLSKQIEKLNQEKTKE